jgi:hypothetical protein
MHGRRSGPPGLVLLPVRLLLRVLLLLLPVLLLCMLLLLLLLLLLNAPEGRHPLVHQAVHGEPLKVLRGARGQVQLQPLLQVLLVLLLKALLLHHLQHLLLHLQLLLLLLLLLHAALLLLLPPCLHLHVLGHGRAALVQLQLLQLLLQHQHRLGRGRHLQPVHLLAHRQHARPAARGPDALRDLGVHAHVLLLGGRCEPAGCRGAAARCALLRLRQHGPRWGRAAVGHRRVGDALQLLRLQLGPAAALAGGGSTSARARLEVHACRADRHLLLLGLHGGSRCWAGRRPSCGCACKSQQGPQVGMQARCGW